MNQKNDESYPLMKKMFPIPPPARKSIDWLSDSLRSLARKPSVWSQGKALLG